MLDSELERLTKDVTLKGIKFSTTQMDPMASHRLLTRLMGIVLPGLSQVRGTSIDSLMEMDTSDLGPALAAVFGQLNPSTATSLILEILSGTQAQVKHGGESIVMDINGEDSFNAVFRGKGGLYYAVAAFALKVNYTDFFDDLPGVLASLGLKLPTKEKP